MHPNRSGFSRRVSGQFIPGASHRPTPRRRPSRRSTAGHDSSLPFRLSERSRVELDGCPSQGSVGLCVVDREPSLWAHADQHVLSLC